MCKCSDVITSMNQNVRMGNFTRISPEQVRKNAQVPRRTKKNASHCHALAIPRGVLLYSEPKDFIDLSEILQMSKFTLMSAYTGERESSFSSARSRSGVRGPSSLSGSLLLSHTALSSARDTNITANYPPSPLCVRRRLVLLPRLPRSPWRSGPVLWGFVGFPGLKTHTHTYIHNYVCFAIIMHHYYASHLMQCLP